MLQENGEIVMIKCPKCGKDLPKEARFCPYCMYRFEKSENVVGATTYNINTNKKRNIKSYVLLISSIIICAVVSILIVYGNIVKKNHGTDTQITIQHVAESTDSHAEQMVTEIDNTENLSTFPAETERDTSIVELQTSITIADSESITTKPAETTEKMETTEGCSHIYTSVTCTAPATCVLCGIVVFEALGHDGVATCTKDGICSRCGVLVEKAFGHNFINRTCSSGGICSVCGEKGAIALKHECDGPICKDVKCANCDYVRKAQSDCYYGETPCLEEGACVFCNETGINYHDYYNGLCQDCGREELDRISTRAVGETFGISDMTWKKVTVGYDYKFDTIKDENSKYYGKTVVGIPITYDKKEDPFGHYVKYTEYIEGYDNNDMRTPFVSEYFEDGLQTVVLKEEQGVTEYYYIIYDGDGEYKLLFLDDFVGTENGVLVRVNVKK